MRSVMLLLSALLLVTAPACAGDGPPGGRFGSEGRSGGGAAASTETFEGDTQAFMANGLRQFSKDAPEWPATRKRWLAMGHSESQFLITGLFAALLRAQRLTAPNAPQLVERARDELIAIGPPAVPFLTDVLAVGTVKTVYDEVQEKDVPLSVDDDTRREAATILAKIGGPAAGPTVAALDRAQSKSGRRFALSTLGEMGVRGGPAAANALARYTSDSDWVLRVEAVHGLRNFDDAASGQALAAALRDADDLVRQKAAQSIVTRGDTGALPALRDAESAARGAGRIVEAGRLQDAIASLGGAR